MNDHVPLLDSPIHSLNEQAWKLEEWIGLSDRDLNWIPTVNAGNDEYGYSEAFHGIDEPVVGLFHREDPEPHPRPSQRA